MKCPSVLFRGKGSYDRAPDDTLKDLGLDELFRSVAFSEEDRYLIPIYETPLPDVEEVRYRQEISKDFEKSELSRAVKSFSKGIQKVLRYLGMASKLDYEINRKGWILEAILLYTRVVEDLFENLRKIDLNSCGMKAFRKYLEEYVSSEKFKILSKRSKEVKRELSSVRYDLILEPGKVSVKDYEGEKDYSTEIERFFSKFEEDGCEDLEFENFESHGMSHVEAEIIEFVRKIHPDPFDELDDFLKDHGEFLDDCILNFERDSRFYISYLDFIEPIKKKGLEFCYPEVVEDPTDTFARDIFDVVLALRSKRVVTNDFRLERDERIIVVTGPNQGGKTTFARAFGQVHYLSSLGLPIPASSARLMVPDEIFTHFERKEDVREQRSKLENDLIRIREILEKVSRRSVVIFNEPLSSAALRDAVVMGEKILEKFAHVGSVLVWVTFVDELSRYEGVVSMVALVDPDDPSVRTFRIVRKPSNGLAYAISIAKKYGLTYKSVKERVGRWRFS